MFRRVCLIWTNLAKWPFLWNSLIFTYKVTKKLSLGQFFWYTYFLVNQRIIPALSSYSNRYKKTHFSRMRRILKWKSRVTSQKKFKKICTDQNKCLTLQPQTSPGGGMVDALVSGASGESRAGSSPVLGTPTNCKWLIFNHLQFLILARVNAVSTNPAPTPHFNRNKSP